MKKLLGILVLGLLLSGCYSKSYETFNKRAVKNNVYSAKAESISRGAWASSTSYSQQAAVDRAINHCNQSWKVNDCVVHSIGSRYVFEESKEDYKIQIAQNTCKKVGYTSGTQAFADCTIKMIAKVGSQQQGQTIIIGQQRILPKVSCAIRYGPDC